MNSVKKSILQSKYMYPFLAALTAGLLTHMPVFANKLPNADAMDSFYFSQNMITSGRWFLTVACGISSFYDLNWVIGTLSIVYLSFCAVILSEFFEIQSKSARIIIPILLVTFPAVTATFAYLYTADGYMLALLMALAAAYITKKYKYGCAVGGVLLALSMGTYQAYLAATMLLCLFDIALRAMENRKIKEIANAGVRYLVMGIEGAGLYYVLLQILLKVENKQLDTYQGINSMGKLSLADLPGMIVNVYKDFAGFALKGNVFWNNGFSCAIMVLLNVVALGAALFCYIKKGSYKRIVNYIIIAVCIVAAPICTNVILLISKEANYHLLMRLQWFLFPVLAVVLIDKACFLTGRKSVKYTATVGLAAAAVCCYLFMLTDNIAYFNMNERYEKTYAYCLRLADRMEQTPGYYAGMPVAMIGVVDESKYPKTDITENVTGRITGSTGDMTIYKGEQYQAFMSHYLGITFTALKGDDIIRIYNSKEYKEMDSFPAENSIKIVDGVMYIKTEPKEE